MTASVHHEGRGAGSRRLTVWTGTAALMLLPVLAIQGLEPAARNPPGDFIFLLILLAGVGAAYELAARVSRRNAYPVAAAIAVAAAMLQAWVNLAVGIIGSEDNPANWIYAGVVAVAIGGALLARFRPLVMACAMAATAVAQALAFVIALIADLGFTGPITVFFAALWLIAARLFCKAAPDRPATGATRR